MKRKLISAVLCVAMVATMLVGCGSKTEEAAAPADAATTTEAEAPAETAEADACPGAGPGRQFFRGGGRGADRPLLLP